MAWGITGGGVEAPLATLREVEDGVREWRLDYTGLVNMYYLCHNKRTL
jgi:hypothetical protein